MSNLDQKSSPLALLPEEGRRGFGTFKVLKGLSFRLLFGWGESSAPESPESIGAGEAFSKYSSQVQRRYFKP